MTMTMNGSATTPIVGNGNGNGPPISHSGGGGRSRAHQTKLLGIITFAIVSSALIFSNLSLTTPSGSGDGYDDTFAAPTPVEPTVMAKRALSDHLPPPPPRRAENATTVSARTEKTIKKRAQSHDSPPPWRAKNTTARAGARSENKTTVQHPQSKSGGMHVCGCLSSSNPRNENLPQSRPRRLRWLHIPKTGTSFISTLWSYTSSTKDRYIDLAINSHVCSLEDASSYSMFDFALMRRYPWEIYGAPNMIKPPGGEATLPLDKHIPLGLVGGTQHGPLTPSLKDKQFTSSQRYERVKHKIRKTGSEIHDHNFTVLSFFRQPEARIVSAYYDSRHASGLPPNMWKELLKATHQKQAKHECKIDGISQQSNPLKCFANFPGIAGCMARMLTGETCADGIGSQSGLDNLPMAIDVILNHLDFVGLTEDWNESICQFHRLFAGEVGDDGRRRWVEPLQGEFSNVHKSTKKKNLDVEHLDGFIDVADTVVYEAVKLKFERMVGDERCYKYMTWDELKEQKQIQNQKSDDDGDGDDANNEDEDDLPVHFKMDEAGNVCEPKSCSDLGKQCGEWDDGCGRTIICGMCNAGRTGLPSTWRVKCMEGQCIDYCPPWDQKGYWFLPSSDDDDVDSNMPDPIKLAREKLGIVKQTHLSPTDAVRICEMAPCKRNGDSALPRLKSLVSDGLCKCGSTSKTFNSSLTMSDFSTAHDMNEMCRDNVARKGAVLMESDTQPVCCPIIHKKMDLPKGWKKQYSLGAGKNLEGEYFDHVRIECGAFEECEAVAREKDAEMAVFDMFNSMCYLARNLVDLKDLFPVTKDNAYRFAIDLR